MIELLKKINTGITIVTTIYTVTKFMFDIFKKYEKKHGRISKQKKAKKGS